MWSLRTPQGPILLPLVALNSTPFFKRREPLGNGLVFLVYYARSSKLGVEGEGVNVRGSTNCKEIGTSGIIKLTKLYQQNRSLTIFEKSTF